MSVNRDSGTRHAAAKRGVQSDGVTRRETDETRGAERDARPHVRHDILRDRGIEIPQSVRRAEMVTM